jgi:DNA invertase Pin-like site-specific DNA recombinase
MMTKPPLPTTSIKPVAYAYSRFSTKDQAAGDSERRQKDKAQAWADANGYRLEHLHDPGISAFHGKNQILGQLNFFISSVRARQLGPAPVLLVENFDRLSREVIEEAQSLFLELINGAAVIVTLHNGKRYARGMGLVDIITALVEMDVAHQHSAKLSMRVKEEVDARRAAGKIIHNRSSCPRWLSIDPKRTAFFQNPERVALVRKMFELAGNGLGGEAIARIFNSRHERPWSKAKYWRGETIAEMLRGRAVLGEYQGKAGYFGDPVITPEQWAMINDGTSRAAQGRGKGVVREFNLFTGFTWSGLDGSKMIYRLSGNKGRKTGIYVWHPYLVSVATISGSSQHRHRVPYPIVEERVLWLMGNLDPEMLTRARTGAHDDTQDRLTTAKQQIQSLEKQVSKLIRLTLNDDDPSQSLITELKNHEGQLRAAKAGLEAMELAAAKTHELPTLPDEDALTRPENRRALRKQIAQWCQKIEIHRAHLIVWFTDRTGIKLNLAGEPVASFHDMDEEEYHERRRLNEELAEEQEGFVRQLKAS